VIATPTHLSPSEPKAEETLGEHGQEDDPAGQDRLHDRHRRQRERADMQTPGHDRHDPADQEPSGVKQTDRAAQRMAHQDRRGQHRAAVLEQNARLVASADASASSSPKIMLRESRLPRRTSLAAAAWSPHA
jgi:hypothetical protein